MKTVTIQVDAESAKTFLANIESQISEKLRTRNELTVQIEKLQKMRQQLQGVNGAGERRPRGQNLEQITAYLKTNGGAKMSQIAKATGISAASTSYTLRHNKKDFAQNELGYWNLK